MGGVNDEVWKFSRMTGGIPDLPESPVLGSINSTWSDSSVGLRANCNNEEFKSGSEELCDLFDSGLSLEDPSTGSKFNASTSSSKDENTLQDQKLKTNLFKTEICRSWRKFGLCNYGKSCIFAHGTDELRKRPIGHQKYKTKMCEKFLAGFCPYGSRCSFIHSPYEPKYYDVTGRIIVANGLLGAVAHSKENQDMIRRWNR